MTQLQVEYQRFIDQQRLHDAQIGKLEQERSLTIAQTQKALQDAIKTVWETGNLQYQLDAAPYETIAHLMGGMGQLGKGISGIGKLFG